MIICVFLCLAEVLVSPLQRWTRRGLWRQWRPHWIDLANNARNLRNCGQPERWSLTSVCGYVSLRGMPLRWASTNINVNIKFALRPSPGIPQGREVKVRYWIRTKIWISSFRKYLTFLSKNISIFKFRIRLSLYF